MAEHHTKGRVDEGTRQETELARLIRDACIKAALGAYENARMDGLCHEGAWEVAVGAMRSLNVESFVQKSRSHDK